MSEKQTHPLDSLKSPNPALLRELRAEHMSYLDGIATEANTQLHLQPHEYITGESIYNEFKELFEGLTPIVHPNGAVEMISGNPKQVLSRRRLLRSGLSAVAVVGMASVGGGYGVLLDAILNPRRKKGPDNRYVLGGAILGAIIGWVAVRKMMASKEGVDTFQGMLTSVKHGRKLDEIRASLSIEGQTPEQIRRGDEILRHVAELIQIDAELMDKKS